MRLRHSPPQRRLSPKDTEVPPMDVQRRTASPLRLRSPHLDGRERSASGSGRQLSWSDVSPASPLLLGGRGKSGKTRRLGRGGSGDGGAFKGGWFLGISAVVLLVFACVVWWESMALTLLQPTTLEVEPIHRDAGKSWDDFLLTQRRVEDELSNLGRRATTEASNEAATAVIPAHLAEAFRPVIDGARGPGVITARPALRKVLEHESPATAAAAAAVAMEASLPLPVPEAVEASHLGVLPLVAVVADRTTNAEADTRTYVEADPGTDARLRGNAAPAEPWDEPSVAGNAADKSAAAVPAPPRPASAAETTAAGAGTAFASPPRLDPSSYSQVAAVVPTEAEASPPKASPPALSSPAPKGGEGAADAAGAAALVASPPKMPPPADAEPATAEAAPEVTTPRQPSGPSKDPGVAKADGPPPPPPLPATDAFDAPPPPPPPPPPAPPQGNALSGSAAVTSTATSTATSASTATSGSSEVASGASATTAPEAGAMVTAAPNTTVSARRTAETVAAADPSADPLAKKLQCASRFETSGNLQLKELMTTLGLQSSLDSLEELAESACRIPRDVKPEDQCYVMYTGEKYHYCAKGAACTYNITSMHERQNDGMGSQLMTYVRVLQLAIETGCTYVHRPLIGVDHLGDPEVGAKKVEAFFSFGDNCLSLFNFTPDTAIAHKVAKLLGHMADRRLASGDEHATLELQMPPQERRSLVQFASEALARREEALDKSLSLPDVNLRHVVAFGSHKRTRQDTGDMLSEYKNYCGPGTAPDGHGVLCHLAWPAARYLIFETFSPATYLLSRLTLRRRFHRTFQAPKDMPADWAQSVHVAVHIRRGDVASIMDHKDEVEKKRYRNEEEIRSALASVFADFALAEYDLPTGAEVFEGVELLPGTPYQVHVMSQGTPSDFAWLSGEWDQLLRTASEDAHLHMVHRFAAEDAAAGRTPRAPPAVTPLKAELQLHLKENPFVTLSMMANSDILVGLSQSAFLELASNLQSVTEAMFLDWTSWKKANHRNRVLTREMRCDIRAVLHHARERVAKVRADDGDPSQALSSVEMQFWNPHPKSGG